MVGMIVDRDVFSAAAIAADGDAFVWTAISTSFCGAASLEISAADQLWPDHHLPSWKNRKFRVPQVRGPHERVFVRGVQVSNLRPGIAIFPQGRSYPIAI